MLHDERFVDLAPGEVHAILLDEGRYLCSTSTMYRILRAHGEVRERAPPAADRAAWQARVDPGPSSDDRDGVVVGDAGAGDRPAGRRR